MRTWWRSVFAGRTQVRPPVGDVLQLRHICERLDDEALDEQARRAVSMPEVVAAASVVAHRTLGLRLFGVQLAAAMALASGRIIEMQTGEGKTLAAVPAVAWHARAGRVHVLTANDYLARRDAEWMRGIYSRLSLSVACIQQGMTPDERRAAYAHDVVYATANELGFDYLRDQLVLDPGDRVLRPFATAVVDEADSILIDEARIPLVIAGGDAESPADAIRADVIGRRLVPGHHFTIEQSGRSAQLTPDGVGVAEQMLGCGNLFEAPNGGLLTAVHEALHAHRLLARDVDYLVQDGRVLSIDEAKGRIVHDRRWPATLQTALEVKEGVAVGRQGRVLGTLTIENLIRLFPAVCGMTGTAATQAADFREFYGLDVEVVPTHRTMIRIDEPDRVFETRVRKDAAVVDEIARLHALGRPVLVGTASVDESERLSRQLKAIPHQVLNARNEAAEAAIVAGAGQRGAVTISTNMAGRGVDIQLGTGVAELGGLHVIGTNRHESRRIDFQLRGRAGRQGDPGSSQFFVSHEDPLVRKYGDADPELGYPCSSLQKIAEGQHFDLRLFLRKYEAPVEAQRLAVRQRREDVLTGATPCASEAERVVVLTTIDELWADYLAAVSELRAGTVWLSLGRADPFSDYVRRVHALFQEFERTLAVEIEASLAQVEATGIDPRHRGATWTYLTTDEPFGSLSERTLRALARRFKRS